MRKKGSPRPGPRSAYPYSPARTMAHAYLDGLSALCDLLRERVVASIADVYASTRRIWTDAQDAWEQSKRAGRRDFSRITEVERHLRSNYNKMIWETTARYGNLELKRVKSEREGPVGPMNRMLNMAGAQLRNFSVIMFPFPEPEIVGRRGKRVLAVYKDPITYETVNIAHPNLPEMDFVDMIRAHVFEIARKCFINDVPMDDARKYTNLLIRKLSPFLEYAYTSGESGRSGFRRSRKKSVVADRAPDAAKILRNIVDEIEGIYGTRTTRRVPPTHQLYSAGEKPDKSLFLEQAWNLERSAEKLDDTLGQQKREWAHYIRDLCEQDILRDADAERLVDETRRQARWCGIRWHEITTNGLLKPYSLEHVVLSSEKEQQGEYLIVGEVPVKTDLGDGRADLVVFKPVPVKSVLSLQERTVFMPIAVFDIKTQTCFNWAIASEKRQSKRHGEIQVPKLIVTTRRMSSEEWSAVLSSTPDPYTEKQLELYAKGLAEEYASLTGDSNFVMPITGTIMLDTSQEPLLVTNTLPAMIQSVCEAASELDNRDLSRRLLLTPDPELDFPRIGIALSGVSRSQRTVLSLHEETQNNNREAVSKPASGPPFILYLSVPSASRSGISAAWIAQYWHGLDYIQHVLKEEKCTGVVWLDLLGEFSTPNLAWTRLRMDWRNQQVRSFLPTIQWHDSHHAVDEFLSGKNRFHALDSIFEKLHAANAKSLIVVSGWSALEDLTPRRSTHLLDELEQKLVSELKNSRCCILFFGRPLASEETSSVYQRHKVKVAATDSLLKDTASSVIWNLPVRPYAFGQVSPMLDDLRIVTEVSADTVHSTILDVPPLRKWSERFWTRRKRTAHSEEKPHRGRQQIEAYDILQNESIRQALTDDSSDLLDLMGPHPTSPSEHQVAVPVRLSIMTNRRSEVAAVSSRLTFSPLSPKVRAGKGYVPDSAQLPELTHSRAYRTPKGREASIKHTAKPPHESSLQMLGLDPQEAWRVENRRMRQVVGFLFREGVQQEAELGTPLWYDFILSLQELMSVASLEERYQTGIASFLESHPLSSDLWERLSRIRERDLGQSVTAKDRQLLDTVVAKEPLLLRTTGNHLILLLLAISSIHRGLRTDHLRQLWEVVRPWHLTQLGFKPRQGATDNQPSSKFSVLGLWRILNRRARTLLSASSATEKHVALGQFLVVDGPEGIEDYWLLLQDPLNPRHLCTGVWRRLSPLGQVGKVSWAVVRHDDIASSAKECHTPKEVHNIVLLETGDRQYLWIQYQTEWLLLGEVELIRKGRTITNIRGLMIKPPESSEIPRLPKELQMDSRLADMIAAELGHIGEAPQSCIPVRCILRIDGNEFVVQLFEEPGGTRPLDEIRFERTKDLLGFLRIPLTGALRATDFDLYREFYAWNPFEDIEYGKLQIVRPFVERRQPYSRIHASLPERAIDFSGLKTKSIRIKVTHEDSLCPIFTGQAAQHGTCWIVRGEGLGIVPGVLREANLSDVELKSLMESEEIVVRGIRYTLQFDIVPDPSSREGVVFRESPLLAKQLSLRRILPGTHLEMAEERILCVLTRQRDELQLIAKSDKTGDEICTTLLSKLKHDQIEHGVVEAIDYSLGQIAESYFGEERDLRGAFSNYDKVMQVVRDFLNQRRKGKAFR